MSYELIRNRIKHILEEVDGVSNVHAYLRDIRDDGAFEDAFTVASTDGTDLLTGWMITRVSTVSERPDLGTAILDVHHNIELHGFMAMKDVDASELIFQDLIDSIIDKFRARYLLENSNSSALTGVLLTSQVDAAEIGHGEFGNYFVHFARLTLFVKERTP